MFLARRDLLLGGVAAGAGALAVPLTKNLPRDRAVDPRAFGASGDGVTDDTTALKSAIAYAVEHDLPVEGGSSQFAVRGNIVVEARSKPWIKSLRLKQLAPSNDRKTLFFNDCERIRIDHLEIDVGNSTVTGYFNESGGLWIDGGSGHDVRNVDAFGHGKNSLISIWNTTRSSFRNLRARDATYDARSAKDDVLQGIFLCRNEGLHIQSPIVANLGGNADLRFPNRYTRGIVGCGNRELTISDAQVTNVDQGIDLTGSDGNRNCSVLRARCVECTSVGIKLANSAVDCRVEDCVAERCGLMGFLASGPAEPGLKFKTSNCDFIRCTAYDPGFNGFADSAPHAGFRVERNRADWEYPMAIRFIECHAIDRQQRKTMEYGFYEDVRSHGDSKRIPNQLINCTSSGHRSGVKNSGWST
jgi:hypothetical protein